MNPEDKKPVPDVDALPDSTRREFCRKSGLLVLGTAAYTVISILAGAREAEASCGCTLHCNCNCTGVISGPSSCGIRG